MSITKVPRCCQLLILRRLAPIYCFNINNYTNVYTIDAIDSLPNELLRRQCNKIRSNLVNINYLSLRYFMKTEKKEQKKEVSSLSLDELDSLLEELLSKKKDKLLTEVLTECYEKKICLSEVTLKKIFRNASTLGKVDTILSLQKIAMKLDPYLYKRNGEFLHYVAKAECMKGNSEKGLFILKHCYTKHGGLRNFYRIILRELIMDSISNRSEASVVTFKKYVLEFSEKFKDHYPLVCFWHNCWSSSWFSDQMLADELLESSEALQNIVRDKATAFSITILREYNEDAAVRLLQNLLKYNMMDEYVKVLQVFFAYKLRNRDLKGCSEIIRNCETLGLSLPSYQQGKYIKMLINNKTTDRTPIPKPNFKLKF